eukprot:CAMPEP_0172360382 /NCGR_PEP_ID=MMETSP1060-20121228/4413_1 /TAXON_ID=37318 /ORGANISM="Pseudo-nitzschia pungens, Strain cf. cingulata" /LENGTH=383 /DNA_ID=CAMNT_0013082359 /DNA_START=92 /DNA_END=1243 /DNA_ORIENTATION=-
MLSRLCVLVALFTSTITTTTVRALSGVSRIASTSASTSAYTSSTRLSAAAPGSSKLTWTEAELLEEKIRMSRHISDVEPIPRLVHIRAELLDRTAGFSSVDDLLNNNNNNNNNNSSKSDENENDANERIITTKIVHFQRHGQGYHNLLGDVLRDAGIRPDIFSADPTINPWIRPEIVDSPLTELGKRQCEEQRAGASLLKPQAVVVSPLLRAVQTAKLTFADYDCGTVNANANDNANDNTNINANENSIPWIAHEGCREELGYLVCNKRRPLSEIRADFPDLQYPPGMAEEDVLWNPSAFESETAKGNRIYDFLVNFLAERPERNLAVVCHSAWLAAMCNDVLDCGGDENLTSWFGVSEIRSVKLTFSRIATGSTGTDSTNQN